MANQPKQWKWNDDGFFTCLNSSELRDACEREAQSLAVSAAGEDNDDVEVKTGQGKFTGITQRVQSTIFIKDKTAEKQASDKTVEKNLWS